MEWEKFLSRKFLIALVGFITVNVIPNLDASQQAKWSAFVAAAYAIGQGIADGFGGDRGSQGVPPVTTLTETTVVDPPKVTTTTKKT